MEQPEIKTFTELGQYITENGKRFYNDETVFKSKWQRIEELKQLAAAYADYEPYRKIFDESKSLSGIKRHLYDREHEHDLAMYENMRIPEISAPRRGEDCAQGMAGRAWRTS